MIAVENDSKFWTAYATVTERVMRLCFPLSIAWACMVTKQSLTIEYKVREWAVATFPQKALSGDITTIKESLQKLQIEIAELRAAFPRNTK